MKYLVNNEALNMKHHVNNFASIEAANAEVEKLNNDVTICNEFDFYAAPVFFKNGDTVNLSEVMKEFEVKFSYGGNDYAYDDFEDLASVTLKVVANEYQGVNLVSEEDENFNVEVLNAKVINGEWVSK